MEAGYYNPQEDAQSPDYPVDSPGCLAATVGVGELPDERLDSLHCIPLDLPASPQPVFISHNPIYRLFLYTITMIMTTMTEENIATVDALLTTSITPVVINIFSIVRT